MRLYFIRHGQSANNLLWDTTGSATGRSEDPELTPRGFQQAEKLGEWAVEHATHARVDRDEFKPTRIYTSLMTRAVRTAAAVARPLGMEFYAWRDLHESGGIYLTDPDTGVENGKAGKPRSFFETYFPELQLGPDATEAGWYNEPHETWEACLDRAGRVATTLQERHPGPEEQIVFVSHNAFYTAFMRRLLQIPDSVELWFHLHNTGITRIDFNDYGPVILFHNRTDHLTPELVS